MSLQDEFDVVSSVYCQDGEYICVNPATHEHPRIKINLKNLPSLKANLNILLHFTNDYPASLPNIAVHSPVISREKLQMLKREMATFANDNALMNTEMILELITWLKDNILRYVGEDAPVSHQIPSRVETCLMSLDHMRSRNNYVKLLTKWSQQLQLQGMVIFYRKYIFVILQGTSCDVGEYISRMKTQKVDVDSAGRACKEKLLTVLVRSTKFQEVTLKEFAVQEFTNSEMLGSTLQQAKLYELYTEFIVPIITL